MTLRMLWSATRRWCYSHACARMCGAAAHRRIQARTHKLALTFLCTDSKMFRFQTGNANWIDLHVRSFVQLDIRYDLIRIESGFGGLARRARFVLANLTRCANALNDWVQAICISWSSRSSLTLATTRKTTPTTTTTTTDSSDLLSNYCKLSAYVRQPILPHTVFALYSNIIIKWFDANELAVQQQLIILESLILYLVRGECVCARARIYIVNSSEHTHTHTKSKDNATKRNEPIEKSTR